MALKKAKHKLMTQLLTKLFVKKHILLPAQTLGWQLATAESCTGGLVAAALSAPAGASAVFLGGFVTYSNPLKCQLLGVPEEGLTTYGAVCDQTVAAMAEGALERTGATLAVSVSGVAGPTGGSAEKPVGLVHFGLACTFDPAPRCFHKVFKGNRTAVRQKATKFALQLLAQRLTQAKEAC